MQKGISSNLDCKSMCIKISEGVYSARLLNFDWNFVFMCVLLIPQQV